MTEVLKAKGRTLAEFEKDLSPAEKTVLAAARDGEVAWLGDGTRPEGVLIVHRQSPGAPPPQEHFAKASILADATWRRALGPAKDGAHLWAARFEGRDLIALGKEAQAPKEAIRLVAARNRRGWAIPRIDEREIVELAKAVADLEARRLRPGFVRFLALGGNEAAPVHEQGVWIKGGWIYGDLDCHGVILPHDLLLWNCRLDGDLILLDATTRTLNLHGTGLKGIQGDGLAATGGVFLRDGFHAMGEVRLLSAHIGGNFDCNGGRFENPGGYALSCDRLQTTGGVFLREGFHATGAVRLLGARIDGDLTCIGGRFDNPDGVALACDGATIAGAFFLRKGAHLDGRLHLSAAKIGTLVDDEACWPKEIVLDGFRYDRFADEAPVEAAARLRWLKRQPPSHRGEDFKPQPWEQLIKVLSEMGHLHAAHDIAIEKQNQLYKVAKNRTKLAPALLRVYGVLIGYGYRPSRLVRIAFGVWLVFALIYHLMAGQGVFGPSNPLVFDNPKYAHCRPDAPEVSATGKARVGNWVWCADSPGEYAAFSPMAYSLDLILPVISLGQANEWGPITPASAPDKRELQRFGNLMLDILKIGDPRTWEWLQNPDDPAKWREFLGLLTRFLVWFETLFGWMLSGVLATFLSGLVKKDDSQDRPLP